MTKNLYVGNLSSYTTSAELIQAFCKYGTVTRARVLTDTGTGESYGVGFVEMSDGADEAIVGMNGFQLRGRSLTVHQAMPREEAPRPGNTNGHTGNGDTSADTPNGYGYDRPYR